MVDCCWRPTTSLALIPSYPKHESRRPRRPRRPWRHAHASQVLYEYALVRSIPFSPSAIKTKTKFRIGRNTQIEDTCIVFPGWHIRSSFAFFLSFLAIVALGVLYEYLRVVRVALDQRVAADLRAAGREVKRSRSGGRTSPDGDHEEAGLISGRRATKAAVTGCVCGWAA